MGTIIKMSFLPPSGTLGGNIASDLPQGSLPSYIYKTYDSMLFGFIPFSALILAGVLLLWQYLKHTRYSKALYATGGNRYFAYFSGINTNATRMKTYLIAGVLNGVAGLCMTAMTASGDPNAGEVFGLKTVAACILGGIAMSGGWGTLSCALGVIVGAAFGFCNGLGVVKIKLPSMIITYAMSNVITRIQFIITKGKPTGSAAPIFTSSLTYRIFGVIPSILVYCIAISVLLYLLLRHSKYGHRLYLVGDRASVANFTGVNSDRIIITTYVISGVLYGLAGVISAGYFTYVSCAMLDVYTMRSIVAVVIGGALLTGGKGTYFGTVAGAMFMVVLNNCLSVLHVKDSIQNIIMGFVIIGVLTIYNRDKAVRQ